MSNSIITAAPTTPPAPAQLLQQRAAMLANQQAQAFRQVQQAFGQTAAFLWKDPTKAQAAFDAFTAAATRCMMNSGWRVVDAGRCRVSRAKGSGRKWSVVSKSVVSG